MDTPLKFPDSPEGKRLRQAREEFRSVMKQLENFTKENRAKAKGPTVHLLYKNESFVRASNECESAERAYYMATGDDSQLRFPPIPRGRWESFRESVEKHFGKIASDLNSQLVKILPWRFGFVTAYAVVILEVVDIERGVPVVFFVTLRPRKTDEKVEFSDETGHKGIGLGSSIELRDIVMFQNPSDWDLNSKEIADKGLRDYAEKLLKYGKSFLTDPNADWAGLRERLRQEREKLLAEQPWLRKYS